QGAFEFGPQEPQILSDHLKVHRSVRHRGIDAKGASVRAPQAAEHGNHLEERRFPERRVDKLPALAYSGKISGLLGSRQVNTHRPVLRAIPQHVTERVLIRDTQYIVEVARGVFRVTAGVRPPDDGDRPSLTEAITQGVRRVRGFGERANEHHVDVVWQLRQQIFKARVTNEGNLVALLLAPDPNNLGHNARQAGVHYACVKSPRGTPGNDV